MRYVISQKEKWGFAAIAGVNTPLGNAIVEKDKHTVLNTAQVGFGGVVSYQASENLSVDFNAGYGKYLDQNHIDYLTSVCADVGYFSFLISFR